MAVANKPKTVSLPIEGKGAPKKIEKVEVLPETTAKNQTKGFEVKEKREDTRGRLAQLYLVGFFICMIGVGIASALSPVPEGQTSIGNLREAIITISGVLSGPLGFIIGFYFRKGDES